MAVLHEYIVERERLPMNTTSSQRMIKLHLHPPQAREASEYQTPHSAEQATWPALKRPTPSMQFMPWKRAC